MITIYNRDLDKSTVDSFNSLLSKNIKPNIAFSILGLSDIISNIIENKNKIHNKILLRYGSRSTEEKDKFTIPRENIDKFNTDMEDLNNIKHEIEFNKLNIDDLELDDKIKIQDLHNLRFMFNLTVPKVKTEGMDKFDNYQ